MRPLSGLAVPALSVLLVVPGAPALSQGIAEIEALMHDGYPVKAAAAAEQALERAENESGPSSEAVADVLDLLVAAQYEGDGDWRDGVLAQAQRVVEIRQSNDLPHQCTSLLNLGRLLRRIGRHDESQEVLEQALLAAEADGDTSTQIQVLSGLALVSGVKRDLEQATAQLARAQALLQRGNVDPRRQAEVEEGLGILSYYRRDAGQAEMHYRRSLELREEALGPEYPLVANACVNLAMVLRRKGDMAGSEVLYRRALRIYESRMGPEVPGVATCSNGLALLSRSRGDYLKARELLDRALGIWENTYGPLHPAVAGALNNLANLSNRLGDYAAAARYLEQALVIREAALGSDHPMVAQALTNLGGVLASSARWEEAVPLLRRALQIQERHYGPESQAAVATLTNLGHSLASLGELSEAEVLLRRAIAIIDVGEGENQAVLIDALSNLSLTRLILGDEKEAMALIARAVELAEVRLGPDNPTTGDILSRQARVLTSGGHSEEAMETALRVESIGRQHLGLLARGFSEREALVYGRARPKGHDSALTISVDAMQDDSELLREVWSSVVRSRGLVLREMAERRRLLAAAAEDPAVEEAVEQLREAASRVASLVARASGSPSQNTAVNDAKISLEEAERALADLFAARGRAMAPREVGLDEIVSRLPEHSALVAFVRYRHQNWRSAFVTSPIPSYAAFVLGSQMEAVRLVPLGRASEIDELVSRWRAQAGQAGGEPGLYHQAGANLRRRIWDPVAQHLRNADAVFVVPDGSLHLVNLASLPAAGTGYLVEEGPLVAVLSEERDLVAVSVPSEVGGRAIFFGDPDFDLVSVEADTVEVPFVLRGSASSCDAYTDLRFCDLPATGAEARVLGAVWRRSRISLERPTVLIGGDASETAFRQQAPGARVIHLATHGFFLGGSCSVPQSVAPGSRGVGGLGPAPSFARLEEASEGPVENPLLLSGVALAGANRLAEDTPGHADGILSAEEIATLDLSGTEWAVLSACDSGLGNLQAGEGVFGLRRAFRVAGARTLIMSLWSVEDEAARTWMEALYRARFEDELSTAAAVRQASLTVLDGRRRDGKSTHPFYWAGFVAAGDWR